jgi:hypothetical protein
MYRYVPASNGDAWFDDVVVNKFDEAHNQVCLISILALLIVCCFGFFFLG